jgi:hypothetical protein
MQGAWQRRPRAGRPSGWAALGALALAAGPAAPAGAAAGSQGGGPTAGAPGAAPVPSHAVTATATPPSALSPLQPGLDYHSFANTEQFKVARIELELRVDFRNKVLLGAVGLEVKRLDPRATDLVLDTRDLDVRDVSEKATNLLGATAKSQTTWVSRPFHFEKSDPVLGTPLVIELAASSKKTEIIKIEYVTSPGSPALAWLGKGDSGAPHDPLLFTLPGPIGARSWIPLQDSPQVRFTVTAHIHMDRDLRAIFSGKNDPNAKHTGEATVEMADALSPQLLTLVVGNLHFRAAAGEAAGAAGGVARGGVYGEKALIGKTRDALSRLEPLIAAGEMIAGRFPSEREDLVVLPPLYPEVERGQPRLSYLNASALGAEQQAVEAMAGALAQGWAGYLVTPSTWRDAWIDEGLAGYLAGRMEASVLGEPQAALARALALRGLPEALAALPAAEQHLAVDVRTQDPALAWRAPRAAKARLMFAWLEARLGRERLDAFLRGYFERFAQKSVTTEQFVDYLDQAVLAHEPRVVTRAAVLGWIHAPGLPADAVLPSLAPLAPVDAVRTAWLNGQRARKLDTRAWGSIEWQYFLSGLPASLTREQLADLDTEFEFHRRPDAQVACAWFLLVVRNAYSPGFPALEEYLQTQGRVDLLLPLYQALMKTPAGSAAARRVFAQARTHYLAPTLAVLDPLVTPPEPGDDE